MRRIYENVLDLCSFCSFDVPHRIAPIDFFSPFSEQRFVVFLVSSISSKILIAPIFVLKKKETFFLSFFGVNHNFSQLLHFQYKMFCLIMFEQTMSWKKKEKKKAGYSKTAVACVWAIGKVSDARDAHPRKKSGMSNWSADGPIEIPTNHSISIIYNYM